GDDAGQRAGLLPRRQRAPRGRSPRSVGRARLHHDGRGHARMSPVELLDVFARAADAQRDALRDLVGTARRARTDVPGQYHLDTGADAAILPVQPAAGPRVLSEASGWTGS